MSPIRIAWSPRETWKFVGQITVSCNRWRAAVTSRVTCRVSLQRCKSKQIAGIESARNNYVVNNLSLGGDDNHHCWHSAGTCRRPLASHPQCIQLARYVAPADFDSRSAWKESLPTGSPAGVCGSSKMRSVLCCIPVSSQFAPHTNSPQIKVAPSPTRPIGIPTRPTYATNDRPCNQTRYT